MLTAYDQFSARAFEAAGIGHCWWATVGTTVLGHSSTTATTHQDMLTFTGAVARSVHRPLLVADLAFGTYEAGPMDAVHHAVELVRAGAEMVKLEGGSAIAPQIRALVGAGIPVMGHLGFTPQSVNALSGHRVQGRQAEAADQLVAEALAVQEAGASAIVLELVPAEVSARITAELTIPTIGIGAGPSCDGQVLVWQDMAGLSGFAGSSSRPTRSSAPSWSAPRAPTTTKSPSSTPGPSTPSSDRTRWPPGSVQRAAQRGLRPRPGLTSPATPRRPPPGLVAGRGDLQCPLGLSARLVGAHQFAARRLTSLLHGPGGEVVVEAFGLAHGELPPASVRHW